MCFEALWMCYDQLCDTRSHIELFNNNNYTRSSKRCLKRSFPLPTSIAAGCFVVVDFIFYPSIRYRPRLPSMPKKPSSRNRWITLNNESCSSRVSQLLGCDMSGVLVSFYCLVHCQKKTRLKSTNDMRSLFTGAFIYRTASLVDQSCSISSLIIVANESCHYHDAEQRASACRCLALFASAYT